MAYGTGGPLSGGGQAAQGGPAQGPLGGGGAAGGYHGLQGILDFLAKGGLSAQSYANLGAGATGRGGYGVGSGAHGAFQGLSPYAAQWIQQQFLQKNTAPMQSLFGPANADGSQGAALTGHDLLMAQLHNSLAGMAPATYGLKTGDESLTGSDLAGLFSGMGGQIGGHNVYAHGYDENGHTAQWLKNHPANKRGKH
jgi:hypothetical protein